MVKRRSFIKTTSAVALGLGASKAGIASVIGNRGKDLVLVENGSSRVPVMLAGNAGEAAMEAADTLSYYIGKISGAQPEIIKGERHVPDRAIWIGPHPRLSEVFPGVNLEFTQPEEILIACNGRHLVIAGRDLSFMNKQIEFGTANAVYEFIQKYLDVRWFWPGPLGEDIVRRDTISIPSFRYRYHPPFLRRSGIFRRSGYQDQTEIWSRLQRLTLDSLNGPGGGHAYTDWWERFHKDHPEYFALQPDGTRSGYPRPKNVKMCLSNPGLQEQWLADAVEDIKKDPELNMIMAGENDGHSSGVCMCENCRAWDHPDGHPWTYSYEGDIKKEYVAMSDRYVTYWNRLARMLKKKFPQRDNLYVQGIAYGPSTPPPVRAVPDDNVVISYVGKFPTIDEANRQPQKEQFRDWSAVAPHIFYRPNLFYWTGGAWAFPDVTLKNVAEDFRFLAENNCIGIFVDTVQEHWATQAPQYYLMAQLAWDPLQDSKTVLAEYYRRGFGKAAKEIRRYWELLEEAFESVTQSEGFGPHGRHRYRLLEIFTEVYTDDFLDQAENLIKSAEEKVEREPETYRKRVAFVRTGLELTRLLSENISLMNRVRESSGADREAVSKALQNWDSIRELHEAAPTAFNYRGLMGKMQGSGYQGNMEDYFGPPAEKYITGTAGKVKERDEPDDID